MRMPTSYFLFLEFFSLFFWKFCSPWTWNYRPSSSHSTSLCAILWSVGRSQTSRQESASRICNIVAHHPRSVDVLIPESQPCRRCSQSHFSPAMIFLADCFLIQGSYPLYLIHSDKWAVTDILVWFGHASVSKSLSVDMRIHSFHCGMSLSDW